MKYILGGVINTVSWELEAQKLRRYRMVLVKDPHYPRKLKLMLLKWFYFIWFKCTLYILFFRPIYVVAFISLFYFVKVKSYTVVSVVAGDFNSLALIKPSDPTLTNVVYQWGHGSFTPSRVNFFPKHKKATCEETRESPFNYFKRFYYDSTLKIIKLYF